ncbi:MAG TPA: hypothetical protein VEQ58_15915, partial [Polyangiaceae bacterium]|nr:hypothetical protein [Polyangiaceae bacterium]
MQGTLRLRAIKFLGLGLATVATALASPRAAHAQDAPPPDTHRSQGWKDATNILTLSSLGVQLLMPRVFYSDPEVTVGWKARWHASVLAPSMALIATGLVNEQFLKDSFKGMRVVEQVLVQDPNQGTVRKSDLERVFKLSSGGKLEASAPSLWTQV